MVAPLSDVPQEGSSVFSLFSLIKLHLASFPLASSYSRVAVSSVFWAQNIYIFGPNAWGPVNRYAGAPTKTKSNDTMSLGKAQFYYIGSRIGWVSALLHKYIYNPVCSEIAAFGLGDGSI